MANRKNVSSLGAAQLTQLRTLLDQYISKPTDNRVAEHQAAGMDMSLMIHKMGFVAWHQHFVAKLENWLVMNGGTKFAPLPFWDAATAIPTQLDNGNTNAHIALPNNLTPTHRTTFPSTEVSSPTTMDGMTTCRMAR